MKSNLDTFTATIRCDACSAPSTANGTDDGSNYYYGDDDGDDDDAFKYDGPTCMLVNGICDAGTCRGCPLITGECDSGTWDLSQLKSRLAIFAVSLARTAWAIRLLAKFLPKKVTDGF